MHLFINIGVQFLETLFAVGLALSTISIVLGTIDDIKTFIRY
jgi:hypothetical protein